MSLSFSQFHDDLYDEHVEEAAFMYELVRSSIAEADFPWSDAREFDQRAEAHVDALLIGAEPALERSRLQAGNGPGELHVHVTLLLRMRRAEELAENLSALGLEDRESLDAIALAITEHADKEQLVQLTSHDADAFCSLTLLALHRALVLRTGVHVDQTLLPRLQQRFEKLVLLAESPSESEESDTGETLPIELFCAVAHPAFIRAHKAALESDDKHLQQLAVFSLQYMAADGYRDSTVSALSGERMQAAGMCVASRGRASALLRQAGSPGSEDVIHALGLSGLPEAVKPLVMALQTDFAEPAAEALYCITGAALYEEVFEQESIDEDLLFEHEREALEAGEAPKRADGSVDESIDESVHGEERSRLSVDAERWKRWLSENRSRFSAGLRYRLGEAITVDSLLRVLGHESTPHWVRVLTAQELRVRHGLKLPFDVHMPVVRQRQCLQKLQAASSRIQGVEPGQWYLAGQRQMGME